MEQADVGLIMLEHSGIGYTKMAEIVKKNNGKKGWNWLKYTEKS